MKRSALSEQGKGLKRTLSGFFLAPLVIAIVLYAPPVWLAIVVAVVIALALKEYTNLTSSRDERFWVLPAGALTPFMFLYYGGEYVLLFMMAAVFVAALVAIACRKEFTIAFTGAAKAVFGILYVGITASYIVFFPELQGGRWLLLCGLLVIWANDIFAYITGRLAGNHRLSPRISPKKTVEGAIGGVLGGLVVAVVFTKVVDTGLSVYEMAVASLIIGVVALCGDLFESIIKRAAGVKDSGAIIPGHGGILDRIDSMLFSLPVFYYYLVWRL